MRHRVKWNIDLVQIEFGNRGYVLLDKVYLNNKQPMQFLCEKHPTYIQDINLNNLLNNHGCYLCGMERSAQSGRYTIKQVFKEFENRGLILKEKEYSTNNKQHLRYVCIQHSEFGEQEISLNKLLLGRGCRYCGRKRAAEKQRPHIEAIIKDFKNRGYTLLERTYINRKKKMAYVCDRHPEDGEQFTTYLSVKRESNTCRSCLGESRKFTLEQAKAVFASVGLILLATEYIDSKTLMPYQCPKHPNENDLKIRLLNVTQRRGCRLCWHERNKGSTCSAWKGGVTEISKFLREQLKEWKMRELKKRNFCCFFTGEKLRDNMHIHHSKSFASIRDETLTELNLDCRETIGQYKDEELSSIRNLFLFKHLEVEGIPMRDDIHSMLHSHYGASPTMEEVYRFKYDHWDAHKGSW